MAHWFARDIWQGRPLVSFLGEDTPIPESLSDLADTGPLVFNGRFPLVLMFVAPLLWFLAMMLLAVKATSLSFELRIALSAILPMSLIAISTLQKGWSIALTHTGVEFASFGGVVHCPWRVFDVDGWPIFDNRYRMLILPVNVEHTPAIEKRRRQMMVGTGSSMRTFQVRLPDDSRLRLRGYYGVDLVELGELILHLGRCSRTSNARMPDRRGDAAGLQHFRGGWRTVDLARDAIPACCCGCGGANVVLRRFVHAPWYAVIQEARVESELRLPVCPGCWKRHRARQWIIASMLLAVALGCFAFSLSHSPGAVFGVFGGGLVIGMIPILARTRVAGAPARLRRFKRTSGTVEVWTRFSNFFVSAADAAH